MAGLPTSHGQKDNIIGKVAGNKWLMNYSSVYNSTSSVLNVFHKNFYGFYSDQN